MKTYASLGIILIVLLLTGCAPSLQIKEMSDDGNSLVFGYINVMCMSWVQLQAAPGQQGPQFITINRVIDGLFYLENVPPGSYQILRFGCGGTPLGKDNIAHGPGGATVFQLPQIGKNESAVRITKSGVYYMGSFKYEKVKTGFFEDDKFRITKSESPSERQILDRFEKFTRNTKWNALVLKKMETVH